MAALIGDEQLIEMLDLIEGTDSVELKLTVPESDQRSAIARSGWTRSRPRSARSSSSTRPTSQLDEAGVVVRARRVQGKGDDSVVKLRPVVPAELPAELRRSAELQRRGRRDAGRLRLLGVVQGRRPARATVQGRRRTARAPLRKLFSKEQRAFYAAHAPEGSRSTT